MFVLISSTAYVACRSSSDDEASPSSDDGGASGTSGASGVSGASGTAGAGRSEGGDGPGTGGDGPGSGGDGPAGGNGSSTAGSGSNPGGSGGMGGLEAVAGAGDAESGDGGGGATGGSGEVGVVTFETFAFYRPALVSGADGVLHMVFNTNTSPSTVEYARCAGDCGVGANWESVIVDTHAFSGSVRLVAGSDDRLHLLYDVSNGSGAAGIIYATCASNCAEAASWTKTDLASLFGGGWNSPSNGAPLVIDAQDRLTFTVDRKIYLDGGLTLATCAADCTSLSSWSAGTIRSSGTRTSLAARGTTLHQLVDNTTTTTSANALSYRTCAANCTQAASWQELPDLFVYDGLMPNAISVTEEEEVRVVYNQGPSDASQPAPIKAQDNKMLIWGCDANCLEAGSWSGFVTGAAGDGADGIAMAERGGALVLSVTNTNRVFTRYCGQNCLLDTSWAEADVDTTLAVTNAYDPFALTASTCGGNAPVSATWHLAHGVVAIRPDGALAFAHAASMLRSCPNSTRIDYLPGYGRLVFVP